MSDVQVKMNPGWEDRVDLERVYARLGPSIVNFSKSIVPIDTRELHDSIDWVVRRESLPVLYILARAPHSLFVELGTIRMSAQPYLRPAVFRRWY